MPTPVADAARSNTDKTVQALQKVIIVNNVMIIGYIMVVDNVIIVNNEKNGNVIIMDNVVMIIMQ